jgi:hypothetical protein
VPQNPVWYTWYGLVVGVSPTASDNYDAQDWAMIPGANPPMNAAIYHAAAQGWTGPEGFYWVDVGEPFATEKTWTGIYLWWRSDWVDRNYPIYFGPSLSAPPPAYYRFTLYLDQVPAGVTYNGPWQWEAPATTWTEIPAGTFTPFASETGLDGYKFHLTVVVPEPGSLLALAGGLTLLHLRRRRR